MLKLFALLPVGVRLIAASPLETRDSLSITVPSTTPSGASDVVDHGYPAFAMSQHSFHEYAGNLSSPNTFSANLISEVSSRTGAPVHIRVGGTSGDFSHYDPTQDTALVLPPGTAPGSIPHGMSIGNAWFEGFQSFSNVRFTYQTHFANYSDIDNSVLAAQKALSNIGSNLDALEIGNEWTFYPNSNRPAGYGVSTLIPEWKAYADAVENATGSTYPWQAPVLYGNNCPWCVAGIFQAGIDAQGHSITSASVHHYPDGGPVPTSALQTNYMNHTRTQSQLNVFTTPINWLKANRPNIPFHFGENNSNTYSTGNNDTLGVFGSALWLADYMLYGMTINAKRMNIQQSTGFSYTSWRGVDYYGLPAAVMPPYYAHPFVADIIGNSGDIRIADLKLGKDTFAAYGVWDASSNRIKRVVLFNLNTWRTTSGTTRPSTSVTLNVGSLTGSYKVDKLTAPGADTIDASKVSWKGTSWTFASNGKPVQGASTSVTVRGSRGRIGPITVRASEAVVVNLG